MPSVLVKLFLNKYTLYIAVTLIVLGIALDKVNKWHYKPLSVQQTLITSLGNTLNKQELNVDTLEAEKEKLVSDMSIVYDNGYYAGIKEGFKYEKSDTTTIHSSTLPF